MIRYRSDRIRIRSDEGDFAMTDTSEIFGDARCIGLRNVDSDIGTIDFLDFVSLFG